MRRYIVALATLPTSIAAVPDPGAGTGDRSFGQFRFFPVGTREFVVYDPRDEQTMISHTAWRIIAPELEGFHAAYPAARPHWRYFWFD